jgi:hypothetical protein
MPETPFDELSADEKLDLLIERVDELALRTASISEIMLAWNNTKGFVKTVQTVSKVLRWIAVTGAACSVVWYAITHMEWPK